MSYTPNHISLGERVIHILLSVFIIGYGVIGLLADDIFLPARGGGRGIHLHGTPAVLMFIAMMCATVVFISVVIDHYDKRDNERYYRFSARLGEFAGWTFFGLAIGLKLVSKSTWSALDIGFSTLGFLQGAMLYPSLRLGKWIASKFGRSGVQHHDLMKNLAILVWGMSLIALELVADQFLSERTHAWFVGLLIGLALAGLLVVKSGIWITQGANPRDYFQASRGYPSFMRVAMVLFFAVLFLIMGFTYLHFT